MAVTLVLTFTACGDNNNTSSDEWEYYDEIVTRKKDKDKTNDAFDTSDGSSQSDSGSSQGGSSGGSQGGSSGGLTVVGAGQDENADYSVKGTVIVAVDTARLNDYQGLFDAFKAVYPNVKLKIDYFAHTTTDSAEEYLATRSSAGNMPDIVYDDAGPLPTYLTQGWMQSLDSFVKNDPDFKYVPSNLVSDYTYGGKLYGIPHQAHYETFLLNTDLWGKLNIKGSDGKVLSQPSLSWTLSDFEAYCKAAVTDKSAAQEDLGALYYSFVNNFNSAEGQYGYNPKTRQFGTDGISKSVKFLLNLKSIPGLEAASLRPTSGSTTNDYFTKFGTGSYSDNWVAFHTF